MNYEKCILNLRYQKTIVKTNSYNMYMKYIPETKEFGIIDPRQLEAIKKNGNSSPLTFKDKRNLTALELKAIRDSFGCENLDLSKNVITTKTSFNNIKVEIYRKFNIPNNNPVIVNIHGGGFFGGCVDVVRNSCKLLAEKSCSTVISVDYDLSPSAKFPTALNQCNSVIEYIVENSNELKVNAKKIVVMGDSAGGNIAAACCLSDDNNNIALQVLLYPLLDLKVNDLNWSESLYQINEDYKQDGLSLINGIKDINEICIFSYIKDEKDMTNKIASPLISKDFNLFPMTLIVSPEYDYLRLQAETFASNLEENGIDTILYRYQGMGHAFYEHLGEFPQAEDCIDEIAKAIMSL